MDAGLRGYSVGDAQVSEKHCGFVVNKGEATAADVLTLIKDVQETFEQGMLLNMGQLLSIPFIIIGIYCLAGGKLCRQLGEHQK